MSDNHKKRSIGERGGEFIILGIYLFGDVWEFWNVNHLLCLFLAALGIFGLIWYDDALRPRQIVIVAAILVAIAIAVDWLAPPFVPEMWHGWLQAANDPTPPNGCDRGRPANLPPGITLPDVPKDTPLVIVGTDGLRLTHNGKVRIISIGNCDSLSLERGDEGIRVSAPLYAEDGTLLGQIINNGYNIPQSSQITIERSGDLSTLVVHNKDKELLYVRYVNPNAIKVRGIFTCPSIKKLVVTVTDKEIKWGPFKTYDNCSTDVGNAGICIDCLALKK